MRALFHALHRRAETNARNEIVVYSRELPEYRVAADNPRSRAAMLDYAVWFRRITASLASDDRPMTEQDCARIAAIGTERGAQGVSPVSARQVVTLHATLMMQEMQDATGPNDLNDLLRLVGWFSAQGETGTRAYFDGFMEGQKSFLPVAERVQQLARMLLADDEMAQHVASALGVRLSEHYTVVVVRLAEPTGPLPAAGGVVEQLFKCHQVPLSWAVPAEFVALVPAVGLVPPWLPAAAEGSGPVGSALAVVRDFAAALGVPCAVGCAGGRLGGLAEAAASARQAARFAPMAAVPRRMHGVADVFVELAVAHLPPVDQWLREIARLLAAGPDLVSTLDCYYRNDFNRLHTARSLCIHTRTLDYRLRRARELTGIDPGSPRGVRVLATAVACVLADVWG
ncbi:helix-turn-helix domain-containing protein [Actinosynnema sp. NPDC047251]|uniref:Transcriptional regulator, PucR family n=1 Tax=Saccharothrix espanaensis (strain ATCC 51144 / DSM 44229 / JCM 9112 / NBRC 15066 / NRRL 15764) TaxID=1179773 RepID=K0K5R2_SACES|nr:helix-turn-helix domain-containing protein [Saccharothrix espanaensis]CCH32214.1 hypothetical protein BN6_49440 [Saccharothrix espanaensis DSM 44229]